MRGEGTAFRTGVDVGVDVTVEQLRSEYDAVVLAGGSTLGRDLPAPGRELGGIHLAMEYLVPANRVQEGDLQAPPISAEGKDVVIIGGGDTGADCLGTAIRQGARSVTQLEIMPQPPQERPDSTPWPTWPLIYRTSSAHEEGGERLFSRQHAALRRATGTVDGPSSSSTWRWSTAASSRSRAPRACCRPSWCCSRWASPARSAPGCSRRSASSSTAAATSCATTRWATSVPGVFVCGDMGRGQSLIVWAIAEGRSAAAAVDRHLCGDTLLPAPVTPTSR